MRFVALGDDPHNPETAWGPGVPAVGGPGLADQAAEGDDRVGQGDKRVNDADATLVDPRPGGASRALTELPQPGPQSAIHIAFR